MADRNYEVVSGFFIQLDGPSVIQVAAVANPPRFGLVDDSPNRWISFKSRIHQLNEDADSATSYKVIFFGRHGEGYHNVGVEKYGRVAWDDYWSKLNGDGEINWGRTCFYSHNFDLHSRCIIADAQLTSVGKGQAVTAHNAWKTELPFNIPLPEKLYCSPMSRAMQTAQITFDGIISDENRSIIVVENCREIYGIHTCDKRRSRSYINNTFPQYKLEPGFTEEDELYEDDVRETNAQAAERAKKVLDMIFSEDNETFISITAHGGILNGVLASIERSSYRLATGGVLPIVIKSTLQLPRP